ncbi:unnamed protein product [Eruca vesicaria subsp. sativa]|uniref:Uncharacterized protein n=1 Tax=Eruca vesicaria subsp. sativa TaxID=29727 RepID=A0ABC8JGA1_ERUVS|nr:unnamed protein product [Eruca vesicaria subsp. sativa]
MKYIVLECLAERTLADCWLSMSSAGHGYDPREKGTCIIKEPPVAAFQKLCPRICNLLNNPNYLTKASLLPVVGSLSQNKLQNLAGQRSDVHENLSPIVRACVDAFKDIQDGCFYWFYL